MPAKCESFHRYFGQHFSSPSPNIFTFLDALEQEQDRTILKIRSMTRKITIAKRKAQREKEEKRHRLKYQLEQGEIKIEEFINQMYVQMLPPKM